MVYALLLVLSPTAVTTFPILLGMLLYGCLTKLVQTLLNHQPHSVSLRTILQVFNKA